MLGLFVRNVGSGMIPTVITYREKIDFKTPRTSLFNFGTTGPCFCRYYLLEIKLPYLLLRANLPWASFSSTDFLKK